MASENTYPMSPEDLIDLLPQDKADLFKATMAGLSPADQATIRRTLAWVPDSKWDLLVTLFTAAPPGHLRHYVFILGAHYPGDPEPRKAPSTKQQWPQGDTKLSGEDLRAGLERLPTELRDKVQKLFIANSVGSEFIFPDQKPGPNGMHLFRGTFYPPAKYEVLLGLDWANYEWHGSLFWDSFFVIGPGRAHYSMQWLDRMSGDVQRKVRNVYINLSHMDLDDGDRGTEAEHRMWTCHQQGAVQCPLEMFSQVDQNIRSMNSELDCIWWNKLELLTQLKLKNLVIDVRNARGIDDTFLGADFMSVAPRFGSRRPKNVKILADKEDDAVLLQDIFDVRNPVWQ